MILFLHVNDWRVVERRNTFITFFNIILSDVGLHFLFRDTTNNTTKKRMR